MAREDTWRERAEKVVNLVCDAFPSPEFENWGLCEELILSASSACEQISKFEIETENAALLLRQTTFYLKEQGKYKQCIPLIEKNLTIYESVLGKNHFEIATSLNCLAELYRTDLESLT